MRTGEERMRVVLHKGTDEVTFDVCSISRGNGLLGQLAFPFTALMQVIPLPLHMTPSIGSI
jgi:hypothetical protein